MRGRLGYRSGVFSFFLALWGLTFGGTVCAQEEGLFLEGPSGPTPLVSLSRLTLSVGTRLSTSHGSAIYLVTSFIEKEDRADVYRVVDESGNSYALKLASDSSPETREALRQESLQVAELQKLGLEVAAVHAQGPGFVFRAWVEGTRLDEWLRNWERAGFPEHAPEAQGLVRWVRQSAMRGAYVSGISAKNLVWSDEHWTVIDSGGVQQFPSFSQAMEQYRSRLPKKWKRGSEELILPLLKLLERCQAQ